MFTVIFSSASAVSDVERTWRARTFSCSFQLLSLVSRDCVGDHGNWCNVYLYIAHARSEQQIELWRSLIGIQYKIDLVVMFVFPHVHKHSLH